MKLFRQNVAIVVLNDEGKILTCRRADRFRAWQLPQGGIEEGESPEDALFRELEEEIGTRSVTIIGKLPFSITYEWPEHLRDRGYFGQEQSYFLVRLNSEAVINLESHAEPEFDHYEWLTSGEFLKRAVGFKEEAYRTALEKFAEIFPGVLA